MKRSALHTDQAPAAIGPYVQAVRAGEFVFCSGQLPVDPRSGEMVTGSVEAATEQCLANLEAVLAAAGASLADAVKATVFLRDMNDFPAMNAAYAKRFGDSPPARACVQVARLPKDAPVEIELIAAVRG